MSSGETLLVCSTGGHLSELWQIKQRIVPTAQFVWAVPEHPQSASLLADEEWIRIPYFGARDWRAALRTVPYARALLSQRGVSRVVSTGGSVVTPYMVAAASLGIPRFYIETVARTTGPSMTGRFAAANPGTRIFTQHEQWAGRRWQYIGNVFDGFSLSEQQVAVPDSLNVLVTLGTNPFPFDRAVRAIQRALPPNSSVTWQLGPGTDLAAVPDAVDLMGESELQRLMGKADVVIAHAGAGSAMAALQAGRQPILIPRLARYGEMVDDHQLLIGSALARKGLVQSVDAADLSEQHVQAAASHRIEQVPAPAILLG
jgi:UDP-N-acetylglucosamine transferase subunit ALG13